MTTNKKFDPLNFVCDEFSVVEINEFYEIFTSADDDESMTVDADELQRCLRIADPNISRRELAEIIDEVDTDGSGDISFEEFLDIMKKRKYQNFEEEELRVAFHSFDKNRSEFIEADDVKKLLASLGENISEADAIEMVRIADTDGDGKVSFEDYKTFIESITDY
ncbi:neo-calmodulin-like [Symsagittifera roscoffensis]|uniref:neo-calmodulin-like n=1 Tax=Symsagittifera roscoffensis TaxID=84072 RepID=UPI00307C59FF